MGIVKITTDVPAQIGVAPRRVKIISTDNLATVTAAGYLNSATLEGYTIYNTDIIDMWYGATVSTGPTIVTPGTFESFTASFSNGVITLVGLVNPGDVLLPVVSGDFAVFNGTSGQIKDAGYLPSNAAKTNVVMANGATILNHIATYSDTAGTVSEDAATAINGGNIQAGLSGTAGTVASFPGTAAKGSLILAGVANTGNTNTTISNDAMGQASVVNIPDPANAIGQFMVGATATPFVSGNFPQASGTAGLFVDSGVSAASVSGAVTQLGTVQQVSVTLTPSQMVTAYDTPLTLIAAPGATKMIQIISAAVYTASTGHTAYATGTAPIIQYGTTAHGAGTLATGAGLVAGDITAASSQVRTLGPAASTAWTGTSNLPITFSNATGDYTAGTGTNIVITLVYQVLTATV